MPDFVTIGGTAYLVLTTGAAIKAPEVMGETVRTFSGVLVSDIRAEKRAWTMTLYDLSLADYETLRAAVAAGVTVTCNGAALGGVDVPCKVSIDSAPYIDDGAGGFLMEPTITLREV